MQFDERLDKNPRGEPARLILTVWQGTRVALGEPAYLRMI